MAKSKSFNEVALHTILSTCLKPFYATKGYKDRAQQLEDRLDEVMRIAEMRVYQNAQRGE